MVLSPGFQPAGQTSSGLAWTYWMAYAARGEAAGGWAQRSGFCSHGEARPCLKQGGHTNLQYALGLVNAASKGQVVDRSCVWKIL